jgi:protein-tyrosine phosphatase
MTTLVPMAADHDLDVRHAPFPIPDLNVIDVGGYTPTAEFMATEVGAGRPIRVHCWGGIGTVIGHWLVCNARTADEAIAEIANRRTSTSKRRSPEIDQQIRMIQRWAALDRTTAQR